MSNKKEYAVGEEVQMGLVTLVCEESDDDKCCEGCYFYDTRYNGCESDAVFNCLKNYRTDNKDVIFKLKEE